MQTTKSVPWKAESSPTGSHWVVSHQVSGEMIIFFARKDNGRELALEYARFKNAQISEF